jgi:hypothetical protein
MSSSEQNCVYCLKGCKTSDSKPYPGSKSKDRIHNRCQIKKTLADRQMKSGSSNRQDTEKTGPDPSDSRTTFKLDDPTSLMNKMIEENEKRQNAAKVDKINKLISERESQAAKEPGPAGFFFDVKAGIAKAHEKRQYLHHRNICEIAPRYNDHGFQEEAIGRSYDHGGKDLNSLGDNSDDEQAATESSSVRPRNVGGKRKDSGGNDGGNMSKKKLANAIKVDDKNPCWFCLSSPNVEKHLIIAIGEHCYLTLAKGGLVDEHYLLIPIDHIQSVNSSENSIELLCELENFKTSLIRYFGSQSKGVVFFERNFRSVHWQIQVVPIILDEIQNLASKIKSISKIHFASADYIDIPKNCSIKDIVPPNSPYLYWQIEPPGQSFVCQIDTKNSIFPIQLPRMVLADEQIMNCRDRIDWKRCSKSKDEYIELVAKIKQGYARFDIT